MDSEDESVGWARRLHLNSKPVKRQFRNPNTLDPLDKLKTLKGRERIDYLKDNNMIPYNEDTYPREGDTGWALLDRAITIKRELEAMK